MKQKKKWVIPLCVIGVILLLCAGGLWYMINHSMSFSVGRCLVADNGSYMFIDGNSPIIMSNRKDKEGLFSGLGTGDKILIFHDGIADTYPGRTGAYWCVKLEDGTQADIPEQVIEELTELGWTIVGNEADPDSVTPEPGAYAFEAQYIRTNGGPEDGYPYHTVISSRAELEAYYEAYKDIYSLERSIPVICKACQLKKEEPHDKIEMHLAGCNNPIKPEVHHELYTEQQDCTSHREHFSSWCRHRQRDELRSCV